MSQSINAPSATTLSAEYVDQLYTQWKEDPSNLPESWQFFFEGFELAMSPGAASDVAAGRAHEQSQVASLIYAYRSQGHAAAKTNPLEEGPGTIPALELEQFEFSDADLDKEFDTGHLAGAPKRAKLKDIIQHLKDTYCRSVGVQYTHIEDTEIRRWLQQEMEPVRNRPDYSREQKEEILGLLSDAEMFEKFIQTRYPGQKRFSLEGAETLIPALHALVELAPEEDIHEIVLGMAHRGRLNVLSNILDKSYSMIFSEFEGNFIPESVGGDGDVKYHKGFSSDHRNRYGRSVHISLTANPSHLEAVNPVVEGKTRAKQRQHNDTDVRKTVLPLLIHGDAAFAGQGLVGETMNLSQLEGYRTGGTVHIIVNNQIGFTTDPSDARSTGYATDVAKMIDAPIFHVNGDDPEATVFVTELALRFRQKFGRDVIVDMICYRRHGHNEGDEPAFTQPQLYKKIRNHDSAMKIYRRRLIEDGTLTEEEAERHAEEFQSQLQRHFEFARETQPELEVQTADAFWEGLAEEYSYDPADTKVSRESLLHVAEVLNTVPEGFNLNPKVKRHLPKRLKTVEEGGEVDWSFAESLAFGTLLQEGMPVRLSGQDSQRGTFSQRHAVWHDLETMEEYTPLMHISEDQARFCVYNSPLSEAAVLGFEYGYTLSEPRMLVLWEAQFGDFANGAQVIIDQFITTSASKWQRYSGLVMLLPHGYEGQGPEHSNAYLERYLDAAAEDNIQVCNLTTPAQYFHVLRRQMKRPFRRPLIIMSPKSMLRHKRAMSPVKDLTDGTFREIIPDDLDPSGVRRVVFSSGKIYWDLLDKRDEVGADDVALVRVEQLYPLSREAMDKIVDTYKDVEEVVWAQEETKNRGAWSFMRPWLQYLFPDHNIRYIGRGYAASPATGSLKRHKEEQDRIVDSAITSEASLHDIATLPEGA
ncbi:2-oxoglutarate dehydrogenase E1 component [bacterium]|nr:2-oxoglutarate dehydrogenase E1 component [bacterium]